MLRDELQRRLAQMGAEPDYVALARDVLGIRNTNDALARRLVAQALVIEDRREVWTGVGERIVASAPSVPGVYFLADDLQILYVGKAINLKRRLQTHFSPRRWKTLPAALARVTRSEWREVGSELEALVREAEWLAAHRPVVNVQIGLPEMDTRAIPAASIRDLTVIVPSVEEDSVELIAARTAGPTFIQRTRRNGADLQVHGDRLWKFFRGRLDAQAPALSPLVYSWLAGRGADATRIESGDLLSVSDLRDRLRAALSADELFSERLILFGHREHR